MKFAIYLLNFILLINIITSNSIMSLQNWKKDTLSQDQRIESNNGKYFAIMQGDGNFVLYSVKGKNGRDRNFPTWNSGTHNKRGKTAPYRVVMQNDGNAVLYDAKNKPLWASNSNGKGRPPYNFIMQDDGNLVLYDGSNSPKWASNTNNKQ
jgi:hypothetical protein